MIRNLCFDIHGTLQPKKDITVTPFSDMCARLLSEEYKIDFKKALKLYEELRKNYDTTSYMFHHISERLYEKYLQNFKSIPLNARKDRKLNRLLIELSGKYSLYVATNNPRFYATRLLKGLGIPTNLFKRIVCADDCLPRPSLEQFELLVKDSDKSEWLFFGDRMEVDILPAWKFGIRALLVNNDLYEILSVIDNGLETKDWQRP